MTYPYASLDYASALSPTDQIMFLPSAKTHFIKRQIFDTPHYDMIGCYPRTGISPDVNFLHDFEKLKQDNLITLTFAADVFYKPSLKTFKTHFNLVKPFKTHYIYAPHLDWKLSKHHRYEIKQAKKAVRVEPVPLISNLETWQLLYANLAQRHHIQGTQNFTCDYFSKIARHENLMALAALTPENNIVAMHLWYETEQHVYSHLAAANELGYQLRASYAIYDYIIHQFSKKKWIDFGGCAGTTNNPNDGLARFKRGFSNTTEESFLCGKIINPKIYDALCHQFGTNSDFFPAYRR